MKNLKFIAVVFLSFFSMTAVAQDVKIEGLKNPTIKAFLSALDGSEAAAERAVVKYCSKDVIEAGMLPTGKITKVVFEDENCVQFETLWIIDEDDLEDGSEPMLYDICEEGGKIVSFDLNFGDEDEE